jgi:serine phosphatase RsbU (regulator of sigma subunit)
MTEDANEFPNLNLEEILRKQLVSFAVANEIARVVSSATSIESVIKKLGLGFDEMLDFKRTGIFFVDHDDFSLRFIGGHGITQQELGQIRFGLEFMAGEYGDAVFRNRHVIVESVTEDDAFSALGTKRYAMFPMVGRILGNCWENKHCGCETCPCFEQPGTICWATEGSALFTRTKFEDDKRKACTQCPQFKCIGVLWIDLSSRQMITGDDVSVISSILLEAGLVIENFQMYHTLEIKNNQLSQTNDALEEANRKIRRDLDRAQKIQQRLLPSTFPKSLRAVASHYAAHIEIGGDYFDCFEIDANRLGIVVADVSGHGVSAALVMSMFKTLLKQIAPTTESPCEALKHINSVFIQEVTTDMFVTVYYGIWNRKTRTLRWTNAGHPPMLLQDQSTNALTELKSQGLFLGMFEEIRLHDQEIKLDAPTRLFLYTDGIIEAAPQKGEQFGMDKLQEILIRTVEQPPRKVVDQMLFDLQAHILGTPLEDDITMLCCDL